MHDRKFLTTDDEGRSIILCPARASKILDKKQKWRTVYVNNNRKLRTYVCRMYIISCIL
jgi:hypothetical protein